MYHRDRQSAIWWMPSALVTGATGFVGTHVVKCLLERQHYTTVYVLCRKGSKMNISKHAGKDVHRLDGDVESEADVKAALLAAKPSYVFHLAGVYAWFQVDHARFDRVNVQGVRNVVTACRAAGCEKLIHVSTVLAFGNPAGRGLTASTAFDEATPAGPAASAYAVSKHAGDCIAQASFDAGELDGCSLFLACCIGADPKLLDDERDVMKIRPLVQGQIPATIASSTTFTYVYVRDAAEAIVRAAEKDGNERGERYLVGNQRLSTGEYYDLIASLSGQPRPRWEVPASVALGAGYVASWAARRITGANPMAPADLVRTAAKGTLLFDATKSERELGVVYTDIRVAFAEAIDLITSPPEMPADHAEATERLVEVES